ncbi:MAG: hypothetical protein OXF42_05410 [Candidatus Dadabacteria bacterium]|nr:hypothetical protein [Candidatus Dadabacteria bacterium]
MKLLAPLFVILSGMDIIIWHIYHPQSPPLGQHIEFAAGMQYFQFSSMSTLLYWVPQHGLPGWLGAALFMQMKDEAGFYRHSMLLGACIFLWSFFSALGLALLIIVWFALMPQYIRTAVLPPSALLQQAGSALLLLTVFLYISSNNLSMGYEFFAGTLTETGQWPRYAAFLAFEFALVGVCALLLIPRGRRGLLVALLIILAILPLYKVGILNDIAMRTSIPVLFVFWCVVLDSLSNSRGNRFTAGTLKGLIMFAILVGAVTPGMEIYRSLANYRISLPRLENVKDVDKVWISRLTALYIGHRQSFFFRNLAQDTTGKIGIRDEK